MCDGRHPARSLFTGGAQAVSAHNRRRPRAPAPQLGRSAGRRLGETSKAGARVEFESSARCQPGRGAPRGGVLLASAGRPNAF